MSSVSDKTSLEQQTEAQNKSSQYKNRRILLMVIAVFALPIILAKFALNGGWLATGVTNKGNLLTNELTLEQLGIDKSAFEHQWLILYRLPESCDLYCQKTLETVHNTYVALGKEMPRVSPVALYINEFSSEQLQHISKSKWQLMAMSTATKQRIDKPQVLIVDPLGNVFLSHQVPHNTQQLPQFGKQILADMKKLLKYSKVG
tara:strand:+ start:1898 stop:2506 length:609 start_codon:yes stop_codon:yes gene_type:complete